MSAPALIITYHAIGPGPPPLCLEPRLLRRHLDLIVAAPVRPVSLERIAGELEQGGPERPSVAITFDDGFAGVAEHAAPLLAERAIPATVFCVAEHVGGRNDFATEPPQVPKRPLAGAAELRELASAGIEIGSHGSRHLPLAAFEDDEAALQREIVESRRALEQLLRRPVHWFAPPYGSRPGPRGRALVEREYQGACGSGPGRPGPGADRFALPRVDAHYLRRPAIMRRVLEGGGAYLAARRIGARARRLLRQDFRDPRA